MQNENCQGLGSKRSATISAVTAIYRVSMWLSNSSPTLTTSMCLSKDPPASRSKHKCSWTSPVMRKWCTAHMVGTKIHKCESLMNVRPPPIPGCSPPLKNAWQFHQTARLVGTLRTVTPCTSKRSSGEKSAPPPPPPPAANSFDVSCRCCVAHSICI